MEGKNNIIFKGKIGDVVDMSDATEFWIKLNREYQEGDYDKLVGREVEIHVK